jgi:hypothetical protein
MTLFFPLYFDRQRNEELEKVYVELKWIAKWYACTIVGVPLLVWSVDCLSRSD